MVFLECRNPTDALGSFAGFGGIEALSNRAITVGIVIAIINACFIDIDDLLLLLRL